MNPVELLHTTRGFLELHPLAAAITLLLSFLVLARCAGLFVDTSVAIATKLSIPKLVIGIVLVSLATTAPELAVSLTSALKGAPEMALGNAIGSVICDDGLALALAGLLAASPILVLPHILKTSGLFLIGIQVLLFLFILPDLTLSRGEGFVLVALFVLYMGFLYRQHKLGRLGEESVLEEVDEAVVEKSLKAIIGLFLLGFLGIIVASEFVVTSAESIALWAGIPDAVIALTLVAFGTSVPEVATCIQAARKGHGAIAVGNILGADIMNICWVAGASSMANPLTLAPREFYFMFPAMFLIVGAMLLMLRLGYRLTRAKGAALLGLYILYLASFFLIFRSHALDEVLPEVFVGPAATESAPAEPTGERQADPPAETP
jgi:cation:H+ antiporter